MRSALYSTIYFVVMTVAAGGICAMRLQESYETGIAVRTVTPDLRPAAFYVIDRRDKPALVDFAPSLLPDPSATVPVKEPFYFVPSDDPLTVAEQASKGGRRVSLTVLKHDGEKMLQNLRVQVVEGPSTWTSIYEVSREGVTALQYGDTTPADRDEAFKQGAIGFGAAFGIGFVLFFIVRLFWRQGPDAR